MDRFTGLSIFTAAVEYGSLAAAARILGITPAMAGKHLAAVEASLGVRLMHRTTRRLHLTDVGRDYYQRSRHILESLDDADRAARELQDQPRGTLRVTAPTTFGALHMGRPVAEYIRRYPDVSIEMTLGDRFVDLVAGGFDVAIRIGDLPDSSLVARPLARTEMIACAAPSYLAERGRPTSPSDLSHHDRLAFSEATSAGDWCFTDANGYMHDIAGRSRFLANNMEILLAAALRGAGIAYGPSFVFDSHLASQNLEQVLPNYTTRSLGIHAVYPSARLVGAKVRRFIELLEEWFGSSSN
ncbi:LysR family transcriptional regulator [Salinisphaera sp.]|uniref:LysR family transcriptional regulator n=1 Tax=Salinisphaera sp. TaxID=1914330 RepID=UPI002D77776E|nr:LysR family transcriptional regulator [Salinisphaera sp.]HET7313639.1 LysR family transcriptional regulator [Salinisphaera sp.]